MSENDDGNVPQEHKANQGRRRVKFPLVRSGRAALPGQGITPERIHEILLEQEVAWALGLDDPHADPQPDKSDA
jgi:hypothetical protein